MQLNAFRICFVLAALMLASGHAFAVQPGEALSDPALESRARSISAQLRCLVCQNQSIDDSDAALARDLRRLVRERLSAGDSDDQVRAYLTARYTDFILLKPPFNAATALLWLAPLLLLAGGGFAIAQAQRKKKEAVEPPLSEDESRRLADVLNGEQSSG